MFCKFLIGCVLLVNYIIYIYACLARTTENNSKVQWDNTQNCSLSNTISSPSTKCEIQSSNTSLISKTT